ncbi:hypothetical protein HDU91_000188, partial [Kappamyces sp. JEL0680]
GEFKVSLTIYIGTDSWRLMSLEFLCNAAAFEGDYEGILEIHPSRVTHIMQEAQTKLDAATGNCALYNLYQQLHSIALSYQLQTFSNQAQQLAQGRWSEIDVSVQDTMLSIKFWNAIGFSEPFLLQISVGPKREDLAVQPATSYVEDFQNVNEGLEMVVRGPFNNKFSTLAKFELKKLDLEYVLCQVTENISKNIIEWWCVELQSLRFNVKLASSLAEDILIQSLQIVINEVHPVDLNINPRTGFVSMTIVNMIPTDLASGSDTAQSIVLDVSRKLEAELNHDYCAIVRVIKRLSQVLHLHSIQTAAVQQGFVITSEPELAKAQNLDVQIPGFRFFMGSKALRAAHLCFSADDDLLAAMDGPVAKSCKVWIVKYALHNTNASSNGRTVNQIKKSDFVQNTGSFCQDAWDNLSNLDLMEIHSFAFRYATFSAIYRNVAGPLVLMKLVVSSSLYSSFASMNAIIAQNPPLCVKIVSDEAEVETDEAFNGKLRTKKYFTTTIFIQVLHTTNQLQADSAQEVTISAQIHLPASIQPHLDLDMDRSRYMISVESMTATALYPSLEEFNDAFVPEATRLLKLYDLAILLANGNDALATMKVQWRVGTQLSKITVELSPAATIDLVLEKSVLDGSWLWEMHCDLEALLPYKTFVETSLTDTKTDPVQLLLHLASLERFCVPLQHFQKCILALHGVQLQIAQPSPFHLLLHITTDVFKMDASLRFYQSCLTLHCAFQSCRTDKELRHCGYLDVVEPQGTLFGFLSHVSGLFPASLLLPDRILVLKDNSGELCDALQVYVEMILSYWQLEKYCSSITTSTRFSPETFRLAGKLQDDDKRFTFSGYLSKGWEIRYVLGMPVLVLNLGDKPVKDFNKLSLKILRMVHGLPPTEKNSAVWCKTIISLSKISERMFGDLFELCNTIVETKENVSFV